MLSGMALRMACQRSILPASYVFELGGCRIQKLICWEGRLPRKLRRSNVLRQSRRAVFTQAAQKNDIPFFQRSISSTQNQTPVAETAGTVESATLLHPISISPAASAVPLSPTPERIAQRRQLTKSPTIWTYLELGKPRLAVLIVLTTMSAYAIAPYPASLPTLLFLTSGTFLCVAGANTFNMMSEIDFDGMMSRTRNRPLVRKALTVPQARTFGILSSISGVGILAAGVNPVVALLGAGNIVLYSGVYTYLKRKTILNTWVGAVVGGVPPLMGWAACSPDGSILSHPGGLLLAALLYAWQFPHFNALAYTMRHDYARAGYKMMPVTHPDLNTRTALRYSIACIPICWGLVACGLVDPWYLVDSTLVNGWVSWHAYKFWKYGGEKGSARGLFFASLVSLPAVLILAMLHKNGLWDWLWEKHIEEGTADSAAAVEVEGNIGEAVEI